MFVCFRNKLNISETNAKPTENSVSAVDNSTFISSSKPTPNGDFLGSDVDEFNCTSDCIYKDITKRKSSVHDGSKIRRELSPPIHHRDDIFEATREEGDSAGETSSNNIVIDEKTEETQDLFLADDETDALCPSACDMKEVGNFESICLKPRPTRADVNHNGCLRSDDFDSDTEECTDPSESKSEMTICDGGRLSDVVRSVETSTETLVPENILCG